MELLATYVAKNAKKKARGEAREGGADEKASRTKDADSIADSSSSEDTSDEAYYKTHTILEEAERTKYEGKILLFKVSLYWF